MRNPKKILFAPENVTWGGSEFLWSKTISEMVRFDCTIGICVHPKLLLPEGILELEKSQQITVYRIPDGSLSKIDRFFNRFLPYHNRLKPKNNKQDYILKFQPDLLIINQGFNFNGVGTMAFAKGNNIKYITISHALNEGLWPNLSLRKQMQCGFENSVMNYFVSQDNLIVTQTQLGFNLINAEVIRNPFNVPFDIDLDFPQQEDFFHLACVGRYDFHAKGQDVLLEVISKEKWKNRNLVINFYGEGNDIENLTDLIAMYQLKNVIVNNHTATTAIWENNQGLILTSRFEGLPIVIVEAMLCKRFVIVTDVSGNKELVKDNESGFIAAAPRPDSVDEALERAWLVRANWKTIGEQARQRVTQQISENPALVFANKLMVILKDL